MLRLVDEAAGGQQFGREHRDAAQIEEGVALLERAIAAAPTGPYQLQAAIAALHDEAPTAAETDWPQILALYWVLERVMPSPIVTLNRAVAVAMVPLTFAFTTSRRWNACLHAAYMIGAAWILVGTARQIPMSRHFQKSRHIQGRDHS